MSGYAPLVTVEALELLTVCLLGLFYGSFAAALIWRIPRGVSWIVTPRGQGGPRGAARSACPQCGHVLGVRDLIPVFSWVFSRGRCRYCRAPIGWVYPAVELATVFLCLLVYAVWGWTMPGAVVMFAVPILVAMIVIDMRHLILPDQLNIILGVLGIVYIFLTGGAAELPAALLSALVWGGGAFALGDGVRFALKKEALGLGDVKFFAVCGIWLPLLAVPGFLMIAGLAGVALSLIWKMSGRGPVFPFGPALIMAFAACLVLNRTGGPDILLF